MRQWPYLHKTLFPSKSREICASRVDIVEGEQKEEIPPALFLDSEFAKVTDCFQGAKDVERRRISGFTVTHAPLKRYEFRNALVYQNGFSVSGGTFERSGPLPHRMFLTEKIKHLDRAIFCATPPALQFFGHWMMEACSTALLKREDEALILPRRPEWKHADDYIDIFGFAPEPGGLFRVDHLVWYEDFMQGASHRERYKEMRRRIRRRFPDAKGTRSRVYLKRGNAGKKRGYVNEPEIIDRLAREGFIVLDVERDSLETIFRTAMDADIVITVEGSHQSHAMMLMREGGLLVAIQPSDRFISIYRDRTQAMNMEFGFVVAQNRHGTDDYFVDETALLQTLALYENCLADPAPYLDVRKAGE